MREIKSFFLREEKLFGPGQSDLAELIEPVIDFTIITESYSVRTGAV